MASPDPAVVERQMYLDSLGIVDDPSLSLSDLRNMTGGGSNVARAADVANGFDKKLYSVVNQLTTASRKLFDSLYTSRNSTDIDVRTLGAKGDGVTDDSAVINSAIDTYPGRVIRLTAGALGSSIYLIGDGQSIRLDQPGTTLLIDPGVTVQYAPNSSGAYQIVKVTAPDCTVMGGKIKGDLDNHAGSTGEWGFGVQIGAGADRFRLQNTYISKCWGDGIYLGDSGLTNTQDVVISNVVVDSCRRQGLSIINADRPRIINSAFINTGQTAYTSPGCGIDVEPNPSTTDAVNDLIIADVVCYNNKGGGLLTAPAGQVVTAQYVGVRSTGNQGYGGFNFASANASDRPIYMLGCVAKDNTTYGIEGAHASCLVSIRNCIVEYNVQRGIAVTTPNSKVAGCEVNNNGGNGLVVNPGANGVVITNTIIYGNGKTTAGQNLDIYPNNVYLDNVTSHGGTNAQKPAFGFVIRTGATDVEFHDCKILGTYGNTPLSDSGTGTYFNFDPQKRGTVYLMSSTYGKWAWDADTITAGFGLRYVSGPDGAAKTVCYYTRNNDVFFMGAASFRPALDNTSDLGNSGQKWVRAFINQVVQQVATKTANYNMVDNDHLIIGNATGLTISLPNPTTVLPGILYIVKNIFAGNLTVNSQGTTKTIDGAASVTLTQWQKLQVISDGTQWLTV